MSEPLPILYHSSTLTPRTPPLMPFLLDYLPETPMAITVLGSVGKNRYLIEVQGRPFEAEIPADLTTGIRLEARVREATPERIVLDIPMRSLPPVDGERAVRTTPDRPAMTAPEWTFERDIDRLLERLETPRTETTRNAAAALLRWDAPVNRETIRTVVSTIEAVTTPTAPSIETAAFLISRDIHPTPATTEAIVKTLTPPSADERPATARDAAAVKSLAAELPRTIRALSDNAIAAVRTAISSSPALALIDDLIARVERLITEPRQTTEAAPEQTATDTIRVVRSLIEKADAIAPDHPGMHTVREALERTPAADLADLKRELESIERKILSSTGELVALKRSKPPDLVGHERQMIYHALNQITAARGESIVLTEIPIAMHGSTQYVPLRVAFNGGGKQGGGGGQTSLTIDVDMSHIGKVATRATVQPKQAVVRFTVRDGGVKTLFEDSLADLREGLSRIGLSSTVDVNVRKRMAEDDFPLTALARRGDRYTSVDLHA